MHKTIRNLAARLNKTVPGNSLNFSITAPTSGNFWTPSSTSTSAGGGGIMSSRLMGRRELSEIPRADLISFLQRILVSQASTGSMLLFGLQAGLGPASVPEEMRGSVLPAWRKAYAHVMAYGASINATGDPSESLREGAEWYETVKEPIWREWAPDSGAYMNEGNPFSSTWKNDFYGENYDRLLEIKRKYDPSESLFIWSGLGSDDWNYDLRSGLLCRVNGTSA
jgi:hypothetical protein